MGSRINLLSIVCWLCLAGGLCRVGLAEDTKRRFDIPAGNAVERLNELFSDLGLSIICDYAATGVSRTNAVHGTYTLKEALDRMVRGQNIEFWFVNERAVSCGRKSEKPKEALPKSSVAQHVPRESEHASVDQVVITGTHFHGESPRAAQVLSLDRAAIRQTGLSTIAEVLRTLPQNFDGGPTEDTREIGRETRTNSGMGTAMNLRGIGPGETLVLLNGRRLAAGGSEGAFIDISSIPLAAVERIDILPDSGSAIHGADAIGGVLNIVLRQSYFGYETEGRAGTATADGPTEYRVSHVAGVRSDRANALLALEYFQREALPTSRRSQARSDLTRFGGDNFDTFQSNPGTIFSGGQTWAIPRAQDGTDLTLENLVPGSRNLEDRYLGADLTASQRRWSIVTSAQSQLSDRVSLFADALFTRRHPEQRSPGVRLQLPVFSSNPHYINPAGGNGPVFVSYNFFDDLGPLVADTLIDTTHLTVGNTMELASGWRLSSHASHARESLDLRQSGQVNIPALLKALMETETSKAFNPFGDGSHTPRAVLDAIRAESLFESDSRLASANLMANGPVPIFDRRLRLALGIDYRRQSFASTLQSGIFGTRSRLDTHRDISALFGEMLIPVVRANQGIRALHELDLSLAVRREDHDDVGTTTAPKVGIRWAPARDTTLRWTWTRSFRAPNLADLFEGDNGSQITTLVDSFSPSGSTTALVWFGKNADLQPERAESWTLGLDVGPQRLSGWSAAITYFDVRLSNQFMENAGELDALINPRFAHLITRNPTTEQRETVCDRSRFAGFPGDCLGAPIDALVDLRLNNSARLVTSGVDLSLRRESSHGIGDLELGLDGTYLFRYAVRETPTSELLDLADTQHNPLRLRLRGFISWDHRDLGATAYVNHDGAYRDTASDPQRRVQPWTTLDLQLRYAPGARHMNALSGTRFSLNVQNIFDRDPPFLNNHLGLGYDAENADLIGRFVSLDLLKEW